MHTDEILYMAVVALQVYVVVAIPAGLFILFLMIKAKRDGKIDSDESTQDTVLRAMVYFPKVYFLIGKAIAYRIRGYLRKDDIGEASPDTFRKVLLERLRDNSELIEYLEREGIATSEGDDGGAIRLLVNEMAGTTYMVLLKEENFLLDIRQPDGTYDEYSMERLESLHGWMVFDLVCEHPSYKDLLPPEIVSRISVKH